MLFAIRKLASLQKIDIYCFTAENRHFKTPVSNYQSFTNDERSSECALQVFKNQHQLFIKRTFYKKNLKIKHIPLSIQKCHNLKFSIVM